MVTNNLWAELAVDIATPSLRGKNSGPQPIETKTDNCNGGKAFRQQRKENADMTLIAKSQARVKKEDLSPRDHIGDHGNRSESGAFRRQIR